MSHPSLLSPDTRQDGDQLDPEDSPPQEVPVFMMKRGYLKEEDRDSVLKYIMLAEKNQKFQTSGTEGEFYFPMKSWEIPLEDKRISNLLIPTLMSTPELKDYLILEKGEPKVWRHFVWRAEGDVETNVKKPSDERSDPLAYPWHFDGEEDSDDAIAFIYSLILEKGDNTVSERGIEVRLSKRKDSSLPADVTTAGKTYTDRRQYYSFTSVDNSSYLLSGGEIAHAVGPPAEGIVRYSFVSFLGVRSSVHSKYHGQEMPFKKYCRLRWNELNPSGRSQGPYAKRPHVCKLCPTSFRRQGNFGRHMKTQHPSSGTKKRKLL